MKRSGSRSRVGLLLAAPVLLSLAGLWGCIAAGKGIAYGVSDHGPDAAATELLKQEMAPYRHRGNGTIEGRAYLQLPSGQTVVASGDQIHLLPATTYARRMLNEEVIRDDELPKQNREEVWWTTEADSAGRFHFTWLPAGTYLVYAPIAWAPPNGDARISVAYAEITLAAGEKLQVDATRQVK